MTSILRTTDIEWLNGSSQSLAKITAGTDTITLSGAGGNVEIKGVKDPIQAQSAATKSYVDGVAAGVSWLAPCRTATTAAGTLVTSFANGQTVGGVVIATNDRILIKDQASGVENGVYTVNSSGAPTRTIDFDTGDSAHSHAVFVESGTNSDQGYICTNDSGSDVVGTDALVFVQFTGLGQITAGAALSKTGNQMDVEVDDSTIQISGDALRVKDSGITNAKLANASLTVTPGSGLSSTSENIALGASGTLSVNVDDSSVEINSDSLQVKALGITNAHLAGSIQNAKLSNSSVDVAVGTGITTTGQTISLGGTSTLAVDFTEVVRTSTNQSISGVKTMSDTTDATSSTAGGFIVSGGIACAKKGHFGGDVSATSHISTSDERLKTNIQDVGEATSKIMKIAPKYYEWCDKSIDTHTHAGVMAQAIKKIEPQAVRTDSKGYYSVDYTHLFTLLMKSHQELVERVEKNMTD